MHIERAGQGAHAQAAGVGDGIGVRQGGQALAEGELLGNHSLLAGARGLDVEDEISPRKADLVLKADGKLDADHGKRL